MSFESESLVNRKIISVQKFDDGESFRIDFEDGSVFFRVEGDCCSNSWIEHLEVPNDVKGATLLEVKDISMGEIPSPEGQNHECLQSYETRFVTNRGEIVLEYRNSSNGYYGGYLVMSEV